MGNDNRDRGAPPRDRGSGRKPRGRGRWNEPRDPDRPHRTTEWSNASRNYPTPNQDDDVNNEPHNNRLNEQDYNTRQGYPRRQGRGGYSDRGNDRDRYLQQQEYGRNRQNYDSASNPDAVTSRQVRPQQEKEGGYEQSAPRYQNPASAPIKQVSPRADVVKQGGRQDKELYKVSRDLIIENRTNKPTVDLDSRASELAKPRETKSYSRERHQRTMKQETTPLQEETPVVQTAVQLQSKESLEKHLQALRITVKGSERMAQLVSDQELLSGKAEPKVGIPPSMEGMYTYYL